jgi:hypothetical protein
MRKMRDIHDRQAIPQGLKPSLLKLFTARLKPCPSLRLKPCHCKMERSAGLKTRSPGLKSGAGTVRQKQVTRPQVSCCFHFPSSENASRTLPGMPAFVE